MTTQKKPPTMTRSFTIKSENRSEVRVLPEDDWDKMVICIRQQEDCVYISLDEVSLLVEAVTSVGVDIEAKLEAIQ